MRHRPQRRERRAPGGRRGWSSTAFRDISLSNGLRSSTCPAAMSSSAAGRPSSPDAKARWLTGPAADVGATLQDFDWQAGVHVPLSWGEDVIGVFAVFLPTSASGPTEAELAFYTALADQGAVAVINDRLLAETGHASALQERARLARELARLGLSGAVLDDPARPHGPTRHGEAGPPGTTARWDAASRSCESSAKARSPKCAPSSSSCGPTRSPRRASSPRSPSRLLH